MKSNRLVRLYSMAGFPDYADRAEACATWLRFGKIGDRRDLLSANFCKLRLCPMCIARGARVRAQLLSKVMDAVQAEHHCQYIFLTLSIQNVPGDELGTALGSLTEGWHRFIRQRPVRAAVQGWFRAIEITRNTKPGDLWYGTFHPHLHAIWAVEDEYFARKSGLYLTHEDIMSRWRQAMRLSYDPSVRISKTYDRRKPRGDDQASAGAVLEAAKYATKDSDYISDALGDEEAAQVVTDYTRALHRRRLTAFGGWLKETAKRLQADDLDNVDLTDGDGDDQRIREDLAEVIEEYGWHFGAGDYVLARRFVNPLKVVRQGED